MLERLSNHRLHLDGPEEDSAYDQAWHPRREKSFHPRADSIAIVKRTAANIPSVSIILLKLADDLVKAQTTSETRLQEITTEIVKLTVIFLILLTILTILHKTFLLF